MEVTGKLRVKERTEMGSRANKRLRKAGYLPGSIYGRDARSVPVIVRKDELRRILIEYGRAAVLGLDMEGGKTYHVMVKEIQNAPVSGEYLHVDFQRISFTEEVKMDVAVRLLGKEILESKRLLLSLQIDTVPVRGLPQDIPNTIDIDVSNLSDGGKIFIGDILFTEGVTPETDPEQLVVSVSETRTAAEAVSDSPESSEASVLE